MTKNTPEQPCRSTYKLTHFMLLTLNWVLKQAQTPPTWREARISAAPKEEKEKMVCGSFRHISYINVDYSHTVRKSCYQGFIQKPQTQDKI